jgi:hypothetical protein
MAKAQSIRQQIKMLEIEAQSTLQSYDVLHAE